MTARVRPRTERPAPLALLTGGALLLMLLLGTAFSVVTGCGIDVDRPVLAAACVLAALLSLLIYHLPRYRWAALLGAAALPLLAVWRLFELVRKGALLVAQDVVNVFAAGLASVQPVDWTAAAGHWRQQEARTLFLILAAVVLALALGWTVLRLRSFFLTLLLTLPPVLPVLLMDRFPAWLPFMALLAAWLVLLLGAAVGRAGPDGAARLQLLALPAAALLLAILTIALPREGYEQPGWTGKARVRLAEAGESLGRSRAGMLVTGLFASTGDDGNVDLTAAGPRRYTGQTVLEVSCDVPGAYYLRGSSSAVYTGASWAPLDEAVYTQAGFGADGRIRSVAPLNFPALSSPVRPYYAMTIDHMGAFGGTLYTPYQLATAPDEVFGVAYSNDSHILRQTGTREKLVYFKPGALPDEDMVPLTGAAALAEAEYRQFVYEHYLDVPDGMVEAIIEWTRHVDKRLDPETIEAFAGRELRLPAGISPNHQSRLLIAAWHAMLLDFSCEYDLNAPAAPAGIDFVDYFLNGSRTGYCVHFATAGTMLMRLYGIPARYVAGYTVEIPESGAALVPDSNAHAWVEIYLDGYGWYPVEMTPGSEGGFMPPAEEPDAEPAAPEAPDLPEERPDPAETPDRPEPQRSDEAPAGEGNLLRVLFLLLPPLLLAAGIPLRRLALRALLRRRLSGPDRNRAAILAYRRLERLSGWGGEIPEEAAELARKARFSQHTLTVDERDRIAALLGEETVRAEAALSPLRRFAFRWLWAYS